MLKGPIMLEMGLPPRYVVCRMPHAIYIYRAIEHMYDSSINALLSAKRARTHTHTRTPEY